MIEMLPAGEYTLHEAKPETPDTPKTGDRADFLFWLLIMGLACIGVIAPMVSCFRDYIETFSCVCQCNRTGGKNLGWYCCNNFTFETSKVLTEGAYLLKDGLKYCYRQEKKCFMICIY